MKKKYKPSPDANANSNHISLVSDMKDLLLSRAKSAANKIAFRYRISRNEIRNVTFAEFAEEVIALGRFLLQQDFQNKHIAIIGKNSYQWIVAFFAITITGNVAVALDNSLDKNQTLKHIEHSDSCAIFCSKNHYTDLNLLLKDSDISVFKLNKLNELSGDSKKSGYDSIINPEQPAAIFYTSGTSGDSKGVILTHKNIASNINANREKYIAQGSTLSVLPYHHAYGLVVAILSVFNEEHSVFINSDLKLLLEDFKEATPIVMAIVPLYLKHFKKRILDEVKKQKAERKFAFGIKLAKFLLRFGIDIRRVIFKDIYAEFGGNLSELICGGAPNDDQIIEFFKNIGITVLNGYGLTETSPVVSTEKIDDTRTASCGTVLSCCRVRIAQDGEIFVSGDNVFVGYYKDEKLTQEVLQNGEFATGDLGHLDQDGFLYITGRKKDLIILSNGENISPEEIELELGRFPGVAEVIVVAQNDKLVAHVFPEENYLGDIDYFKQLRKEYNSTANQYRKIADIILRDKEFIKNSNRKILRHKI
ncbi:MAG TPA: AMP-binding protein [Clostridiaceae bacterium]|nr:AMP-binding protein [Clostridiaceae bacterium]